MVSFKVGVIDIGVIITTQELTPYPNDTDIVIPWANLGDLITLLQNVEQDYFSSEKLDDFYKSLQ